jgi:predicted TPR repeat methyltransferase
MYKKPNPCHVDNTIKDISRSEILLDLIKYGHFSKCLDIGCGEGVFTNRISNYVDIVDSFDISDNAIIRANKKFGSGNINFYV